MSGPWHDAEALTRVRNLLIGLLVLAFLVLVLAGIFYSGGSSPTPAYPYCVRGISLAGGSGKCYSEAVGPFVKFAPFALMPVALLTGIVNVRIKSLRERK